MSQCKLGMHSLANSFFIKKEPPFGEFLDKCVEAGVELVEIPFPALQMPPDRLIEMFKTRQLAAAVCVFFAGDAPNPLVAAEEESAFAIIEQAAELAVKFREAGVECIGVTGPWSIKIGGEGTIEAAERFMTRVAREIAEPKETLFYFEPLREAEDLVVHSTETAAQMLDRINSPWLRIHLDTFHSQQNDKDVRAALESADWLIGYIHASGTSRTIPGEPEDEIDWDDVYEGLDTINFDGYVTVECFGKGAAAEIPDIAAGLSTPHSLEKILAISANTLQDAGII